MLRKQILITEAQNDYLRSLSEATGESEGHIVRQAIELHAQHFDPASVPALTYNEPTKPNELES
jgi:predicted DNA-binding protein